MKYLLSQQCVLSSQSECILFKLDMKGRFKPRTMLLQCVHSFQIKYIRQILSCIGYTCEWTSFWLYWKVNHFSGIQTWKEIQLKYHSIACCCGLMTSKSPNVSQYKTENIFSSWRRDQYTCIKKQGFVMRIYNSYSIRWTMSYTCAYEMCLY